MWDRPQVTPCRLKMFRRLRFRLLGSRNLSPASVMGPPEPVFCHGYGTTSCQSWDHRRVVTPGGLGRLFDLHVLLSDVEVQWRSGRSTWWRSVRFYEGGWTGVGYAGSPNVPGWTGRQLVGTSRRRRPPGWSVTPARRRCATCCSA